MGFLQQPTKAFASEKKTELPEAFIYMAILSIVSAVLGGIIGLVFVGPLLGIVGIIGGYIGGLIFAVIGGLWLHLWAYIFGAKGGLNQTLKATFYGGTPSYLLGWIPAIGGLFGLWSLYLQWTGLKSLHGMEGSKAAFAMVITFIIPALIIVVLLMIGIALFTSMGGDLGMMPPMFETPF